MSAQQNSVETPQDQDLTPELIAELKITLEKGRTYRAQVQALHSDLVVAREQIGTQGCKHVPAVLQEICTRIKKRQSLDSEILPYPMKHVDDQVYEADRLSRAEQSATEIHDIIKSVKQDNETLRNMLVHLCEKLQSLETTIEQKPTDARESVQRETVTKQLDEIAQTLVESATNAHMIHRAEQSLLLPEGVISAHLDGQLILDLIDANPNWRWFEPGETIVKEGDESQDLILLIEGAVGVEIGGRRVGYHVDQAVLGEMALVTNGRRTATLRALRRTKIGMINPENIDRSQIAKRAEIRRKLPPGKPDAIAEGQQ